MAIAGTIDARVVDFNTRFEQRFEALQQLLGVSNLIKKKAGTAIKQRKVVGVSLGEQVAAGQTINDTTVTFATNTIGEITIEKYKKTVTLEDVQAYGADAASNKSDAALLGELVTNVIGKYATHLSKGEFLDRETTWQMAVSMAAGYVKDNAKRLHLGFTRVVAFVNELDVAAYLGGATAGLAEKDGWTYLKNFLGVDIALVFDSSVVPRGKVYATAVENLDTIYADMADSDFKTAGFEYSTAGLANPLIATVTKPDEATATASLFAVTGVTLHSEYLDLLTVVDVDATNTNDSLSVTSAAGTTSGTKLTIANYDARLTYYEKSAASAPSAPTHLSTDLTGWTKITGITKSSTNGVKDNYTHSGAKGTIIAVNSAGQVVGASSAITYTDHA